MSFARKTLFALAGILMLAGFGASVRTEETAPAPAPAPEPKPAEAAPAEKPAEAAPAEKPAEVPAAKPAEAAPAPAEAGKKVKASDSYVVINGERYNWEEAIRKFPDMKKEAPPEVEFDSNYKPSDVAKPEQAPKETAEAPKAEEKQAEEKKAEKKKEKKKKKKK